MFFGLSRPGLTRLLFSSDIQRDLSHSISRTENANHHSQVTEKLTLKPMSFWEQAMWALTVFIRLQVNLDCSSSLLKMSRQGRWSKFPGVWITSKILVRKRGSRFCLSLCFEFLKVDIEDFVLTPTDEVVMPPLGTVYTESVFLHHIDQRLPVLTYLRIFHWRRWPRLFLE